MAKQNLIHIASRALNTPLLLEPGYAATFFSAIAPRLGIAQLIDTDGKPIAMQAQVEMALGMYDEDEDRPSGQWAPYAVVDGVAHIRVEGTLVHKYGYLQPVSGMTGYDGILACCMHACSNQQVKGILLDFDTPGGEVAGCFDTARKMREIAQAAQKPVWSLCYDSACSAGMALASVADRRLITNTGYTGSVGVLFGHVSYQGQLEKEGIVVTLIHSGKHKAEGNPWENLPDDVKKRYQAATDSLRQDFASLVAVHMGLSVEAVLATEAAVYAGAQALEVKFADEVVNGNEAIAMFADHLRSRSINTPGGTKRMTTDTDTTAAAAGQGDTAAATAQATQTASNAERARIQGILGSDEAKGRGALAQHLAFKTAHSVDEAKGILSAAAEEKTEASTTALDAAMLATKQPALGITAAQLSDDDKSTNLLLSAHRQATGAPIKQ